MTKFLGVRVYFHAIKQNVDIRKTVQKFLSLTANFSLAVSSTCLLSFSRAIHTKLLNPLIIDAFAFERKSRALINEHKP